MIKTTPLATEKCTKGTGPAQDAARKLPNCLLNRMETDRFSAVTVTDKDVTADREGK